MLDVEVGVEEETIIYNKDGSRRRVKRLNYDRSRKQERKHYTENVIGGGCCNKKILLIQVAVMARTFADGFVYLILFLRL